MKQYFTSFKFKTLVCLVLGLISLTGFSANSPAVSVQLTDVKIIDGDTIKIKNKSVRLWGIDAPELHQKCLSNLEHKDCGLEAKAVLSKLIELGELTCKELGIDRYRRQVEQCWVGKYDVSGTMVEMGYALDYPTYSRNAFKEAEVMAQKQMKGIWAYKFDTPSNWRKGIRKNFSNGENLKN